MDTISQRTYFQCHLGHCLITFAILEDEWSQFYSAQFRSAVFQIPSYYIIVNFGMEQGQYIWFSFIKHDMGPILY